MTIKDVFGLIVRTVGLLSILYGLFVVVSFVMHLLHLSTRPGIAVASLAAAATGYILVGVVFILMAKPITRLVYGRDG